MDRWSSLDSLVNGKFWANKELQLKRWMISWDDPQGGPLASTRVYLHNMNTHDSLSPSFSKEKRRLSIVYGSHVICSLLITEGDNCLQGPFDGFSAPVPIIVEI